MAEARIKKVGAKNKRGSKSARAEEPGSGRQKAKPEGGRQEAKPEGGRQKADLVDERQKAKPKGQVIKLGAKLGAKPEAKSGTKPEPKVDAEPVAKSDAAGEGSTAERLKTKRPKTDSPKPKSKRAKMQKQRDTNAAVSNAAKEQIVVAEEKVAEEPVAEETVAEETVAEETVAEKRLSDEENAEAKKEAVEADPYLLNEFKREQNASTRWTNKQRTLVFGTRGLRTAHRYLMQDIRNLLPHHNTEVKWEKSMTFDEIPEVAEMNNCDNVIFLEARKLNLYLHLAKCPHGPSVKFQVHNIHTMESVNFIGNCLKYSRPLLVFDKSFSDITHLKLLKEMIVQIWGSPRNHPKTKPFHDHVMSWVYNDGKVWFRHYQIYSEKFSSNIDQQQLREIGPRFVLEPIRIFQAAFAGKVLWKNPQYHTPTAISASRKRKLQNPLRRPSLSDSAFSSSSDEE
ncbi:brix domain protein 2 [Gregarina niphandrodes]|uniref:Brix domain protein 2 n=1 Tax=Gregarina niphandrodes TaxID=110365 RepID=A0A023B8G3_GRENI|nr:brix domain protein 2 [Gregarina niphandrodes]EZG68992.1 brix domain protein 2 [Gregarina niphandrodes]|eukprot:XP_011134510.1 brix domain protein 2 [Gregarina niphandrodes]